MLWSEPDAIWIPIMAKINIKKKSMIPIMNNGTKAANIAFNITSKPMDKYLEEDPYYWLCINLK